MKKNTQFFPEIGLMNVLYLLSVKMHQYRKGWTNAPILCHD